MPVSPFAAAGTGRLRRKAPALFVTLVVLMLCREVVAGGFSNLDFGIRRMGMRAIAAHPDDPTAVLHNVAGLTFLKGTHLYTFQSVIVADIAFKMYDTEGTLRPDHDLKPDWNVGIAPFFSVVSDLGTERLRLAVSIYAPNAYGAVLPDDEPTRYHVKSALFVATRGALSVSYDITDRLTVGAGINIIHVFLKADRIMNAAVLSDPDLRFLPPADTEAGDGTLDILGQDITWGFDLGVLVRPIDGLYLGASFASGSPVALEGDVKLSFADGTVEKAHHRTTMAIPFILKAGVHWEMTSMFEVGFDITYWHYQVYQEQRTTLSQPLMGLSELVSPMRYSNSWMWSLGVLCRVIPELELMVGYQKDYSPIPNATLSLENPTRDSDSVSFGVRWQVSDDVRIGAALSRTWFVLINNQVSVAQPPANAKGHGGTTFFAAEVDWRL